MWFSVPLQVWILLFGVLAFAYWCIRNQFSFWAKRGVPFSKPHWIFGNLGDWITAKTSMVDFLVNTYQEFRTEQFCGIWRCFSPTLFVIDPKVISQILVTDFESWLDRGLPSNMHIDPLSASLVYLNGKEWKSMRASLSPAYTPGRLKRIFEDLLKCSKDIVKYLNVQLVATDGIIEAGDVCERYITDTNGFFALGIELNSLNGDDSFYGRIKTELGAPTFVQKATLLIQATCTWLFKFLKLSTHSPVITDFFLNLMKQNLELREKHNIEKHDFFDRLKSLKSTDIDEKVLAAQAFDFFLGGFESGSKALGHALHELAVNQYVQDRLREEVRKTKAADEGEITWESLNNMKYLDMVIQETMRKYPVPMLLRMSVKPYRIPNTDVELPSGTMCYIPVYAIHHDPEYYPEPEKFDPERFTPEAKSQRPACTFLPFGAGPRNCIGLRLGEQQLKIALIQVVDNFKISLCEKSRDPIEFDPEAILLYPKHGIWLHVSKNTCN